MSDMRDDGLPVICGHEKDIAAALQRRPELEALPGARPLDDLRGACAIALHVHQPMIPAGGGDLATARIIGNLQHMMENQHIGDNHNAPVFAWCYQRMGEFIPALFAEGHEPRVMLDYSGCLFYGLRQMGRNDVLDALRNLATHPDYRHCAEWLGTAWGHAVAPSTPAQDFRLHVRAWQEHFAALFGMEALARVRGFSPPEMALPNEPDVAYEFVRTLRACGFDWVLVQEHTVEQPETGRGPEEKHLPHRLICRNSRGETAEMLALIKTQGSDTKLVAQMQPWYEAQGLSPRPLAGREIPPLVSQIADGENGGVMMNEFPPKYHEVVRGADAGPTRLLNGSEYLARLFASGVRRADLPTLQPIFQKRIWDRLPAAAGPEKLAAVIADLRREDHRFHMDGGSWTSNLSWVRGYEDVLGPMEKVSALFQEKVLTPGVAPSEPRFGNALFHLLCSQTSCYRYWGQGLWTDYGREICRRAEAILRHDF